jgi:hypothetical protein
VAHVAVALPAKPPHCSPKRGGSIGWELPSFHPRIDSEVSVDLAVQRLGVTAMRRAQLGSADLEFWSPIPAVQASIALTLAPSLSALVGFRVDGLPARSVDRDVIYCELGCYPPVHETWQIGGIAFGANVGLRFSFH